MFNQLFLLTIIVHHVASQFCGNIDDSSELVNSAIFVTNSSNGQIHEITVTAPGPEYNPLVGLTALLDSNTTCPRHCLYEILTYMSPRNDSVLHVRGNPYPLIVPPGYRKRTDRRLLSCARRPNDCGATVPIYRHYKLLLTGGLSHAYSFTATVIPSYVREFMPICYGWPETRKRTTRIMTSTATRVPG